ncbi:hypothetical protein ACHAXS_001815 [Conticribra weissflogii]
MKMEFPPTVTVPCGQLVDTLNKGIIHCIQSSGKILPSSEVIDASSPAQCQWTEYAAIETHDEDGNLVYSPVLEDLRQFFPPLDGSEIGSDGRPLLYAACLGLLLSTRDVSAEAGASKLSATPLPTFLLISTYLLEELKVDPNQPTQTPGACCRPPLHLVARSCHPAAVDLLLSHGANVNTPDEEGWTALMAACMPDIPSAERGGPTENERVRTIKRLLLARDQEGNPIRVNARNYCGYTALHYACEGLNPLLIKTLLEDAGSDATLRTLWGQSIAGIVRSQYELNTKQAAACEATIMSYLEETGRLGQVRSFLDEERKALDLISLVDNFLIPASRKPESDVGLELSRHEALISQDRRIISALMKFLELDPSIILNTLVATEVSKDGHNAENVYETIHHRVLEVVPESFMKVYCNCNPSSDELDIVIGTNYAVRSYAETSVNGARRIEPASAMQHAFILHRERGFVARQMELLTDVIVGPLQRTIAFGIPSSSVAKEIVARAPRILEMGAGTGYWSYVLSSSGADVLAYDAHPPSLSLEGLDGNAYFGNRSYFEVKQGDASSVFREVTSEISDRALLLVWPNNPDAEDNEHLVIEGSNLPPLWDVECLRKYYEVGGRTVIYVGEREERIQLMSDATGPDCGFCASRKFQQFLKDHFLLEVTLECPKWWMKEDDVTVWRRK